ncbi:response regulator transcription factor [Alteraurantiacibacter buctensis]|uniref:Response regulator n=1 Tax=Alteraurantiacibacter buctensis TaxID=1503981 RepID=A0A844YZR2_9SPHN|nr:response regulator transcription factor [Alteraurantiacibacter buctensis]MXO73049.1 response regulator [Alteraurantiacibacter buctensis]
MTDKQPRLLIIDDDNEHVDLLADYLRAEGFLIDSVLDPQLATERALATRYDALILDVMMPGKSGIAILGELRRASQVPIIMLTARGDDIDRVVGLELGADDYMAKPFLPRELVARVRAVLRRFNLPPGDGGTNRLDNGTVSIDLAGREAWSNGERVDLTASEFNILAALLQSPEKVLTKDELTQVALNRSWSPYDRSIDVHIKNLRHKLGRGGAVRHGVETVRGVGYRIVRAQ